MSQPTKKTSKLQQLEKENKELKASMVKLLSSSRINKKMDVIEYNWVCDMMAEVKANFESINEMPSKMEVKDETVNS